MRRILLDILREEAYFKKKVVLSSGKISNFYIDVRRVSLSAQGLYLISHLIWNIIKNDNITAIGGLTLGADPLVAGVCMVAWKNKRTLKGFIIRKSPKKHGRQKLIEGKELTKGERVIIVDDVATSGASLIKSIEILRSEKVKIVKAVTVVDREEGAQENLAKYNCPLVSLFTKSDFIDR
jgi:orotate phosphoribosyltransferase